MKKTNSEKKVLIIEDESSLLELLVEKFKESGFKVNYAQSAEAGLRLALQGQPDLVLLDIILPKMDGLTMLKKLRQNSWGMSVPVIILSNLSDRKKVSEAMRMGVYDFLVKSDVKLADIVKEVREVLVA